jgi:hypothetical protein
VENILYTHNAKDGATNVYNGLMIWNVSQNIYTAKGILNSSNIFYSVYIDNCYDVWFSRNLTGCQKCIFCDNLENKSYCIHNVQYSKESFEQQKATILADKSHFEERYSAVCQSDEVDGYYVASQNVSGDFIYHSEDVENGYFVSNVKGGRNLVMVGGDGHSEHCYDLFSGGNGINNYLCGSTFVGGKGSSNVYCCSHINTGNNMYYSYLCLECSYCLGCIGLKNKSYCIFNKQYTKEERHEKVDEIFTQMEKD